MALTIEERLARNEFGDLPENEFGDEELAVQPGTAPILEAARPEEGAIPKLYIPSLFFTPTEQNAITPPLTGPEAAQAAKDFDAASKEERIIRKLRHPAFREEMVKEATWNELSPGAKLELDLARAAQGAGSAVGGMLEGAGTVAAFTPPLGVGDFPDASETERISDWLERRKAMTPQEQQAMVTESPATRAGRAIKAATEKAFPQVQPQSITRPLGGLAEGVGNMVPMLGVGVLGVGPAIVSGTLMELSDAYEAELQRQETAGEPLDPDKAFNKSSLYAGTAGAIEAKLGAGRVLNKIRKYFGEEGVEAAQKGGLEALKAFGKERAKDFGAGWLEESSQRLAQDLIVEGRPNLAAIWQEGMMGGGAQAFIGGAAQGMARAGQRAQAAAERRQEAKRDEQRAFLGAPSTDAIAQAERRAMQLEPLPVRQEFQKVEPPPNMVTLESGKPIPTLGQFLQQREQPAEVPTEAKQKAQWDAVRSEVDKLWPGMEVREIPQADPGRPIRLSADGKTLEISRNLLNEIDRVYPGKQKEVLGLAVEEEMFHNQHFAILGPDFKSKLETAWVSADQRVQSFVKRIYGDATATYDKLGAELLRMGDQALHYGRLSEHLHPTRGAAARDGVMLLKNWAKEQTGDIAEALKATGRMEKTKPAELPLTPEPPVPLEQFPPPPKDSVLVQIERHDGSKYWASMLTTQQWPAESTPPGYGREVIHRLMGAPGGELGWSSGYLNRGEKIVQVGGPTPPPAAAPREVIGSGKPNGAQVEVQYDVVEAADLKKMLLMNVGADQTRSRAQNRASEEQINEIASKPDFQYLMRYADSVHGAPVIDDVVLAGNGRASGIVRMYEAHPENAAKYRERVLQESGPVSDKAKGMKEPILVRRVTNYVKGSRRDFVVESNPRNATLLETASELALNDFNAFGDLAAYEVTEAGNLSANSARIAADKLRAAQRPVAQSSTGEIDQAELNRRFQRAALAKMAQDANIPFSELTGLVESEQGRRLVNITVQSAPKFAGLDADLALGSSILNALTKVQRGLRAVEGGAYAELPDWVKNRKLELQIGRPLPAEAELLLEIIAESQKKPTLFRDLLNDYIKLAKEEQRLRTAAKAPDLFGQTRTPVTGGQLLRQAIGGEPPAPPAPPSPGQRPIPPVGPEASERFAAAAEQPELRLEEPGMDPDIQASAMGGYSGPPQFSGLSIEELNANISAREELISNRVNVEENSRIVQQLTAQRDRLRIIVERVDNLLIDHPEYNRLKDMIEENPDHEKVGEWKQKLQAIVSQLTDEVAADGFNSNSQGILGIPFTTPKSAVPKTLVRDVKSMDEIMRMLQKGLGVPIRYKSWQGGGFFDRLLNYIRVKRVVDYPAQLHEAGHALDHVYDFRHIPAVERELLHLGDPSRPGSRSSWTPHKSKNYRLGEGVAEFIRYWAFDPVQATALAPQFEKVWEAIIDANPKALNFMRDVRKGIQEFAKADPEATLKSKIVTGDPGKRPMRFANAVASVFDELHYLKLASDDAWLASKGTLRPSQDPYILYRLLRGNFGRADAWIRSGTVDATTGNVKLGGSLMDALEPVHAIELLEGELEPVKGDLEDFRAYLVARQAHEMIRKGKEPGFDMAEIRTVLARHGAKPNFIEAFNRIQAWQDALLQYSRDSGFITAEGYARMKQENVIYVPMRRLFEVGVNEAQIGGPAGASRQLGRIGKPSALRGRKGSERPVLDPIASMIENAYYITFAAEKNRALTALADLVSVEDMGKWIGPYPAPQEKVVFKAGRIRDQLSNLGMDVSGLSDDTLLDFWRGARHEPTKDNVIRIRRNGKYEYYQLHPDLYKAIMAMDKWTLDGIMKWFAYPGQVLRAGVTADPTFALYRNPIRDTINAAVISKYTTYPFEAALRGAYALIAPNIAERIGFKNHADMLRTMVAEWKAGGADNAIETAYFDRDKLAKFIRKQITNDLSYTQRGLYWIGHPLRALRVLTQIGESSTRIGEYQKVFQTLKKKGWSPQDAHLQAAFESRDLQDFAMQGNSGAIQVAKILTPFFNAALQGKYRFARALYDRRNPRGWIKVLLKGSGFVLMAKMLEQYLNWDNDDYWNQPRWQRLLAFHFPIGTDKSGHTRFLLLPVPFETGLIFASFPGAIMEWIKTRNPDAVTAFGKHFARQVVDNPVPPAVTTAMELMPELGYDYFRQRNILPRGAELDPYWARWTDTTSASAKRVGKMLNVSPGKIEHVLRGTAGGVGTAIVHHGVDRILELSTGDQPAPLRPDPLRTIITQPRGTRSQIIDDFYQKLGELKREQQARKKHSARNPEINVEQLEDMLVAEREMANLRKQYQGSYDQEKRQRLSLRMENMARKYVRTPAGKYKGFLFKHWEPNPAEALP